MHAEALKYTFDSFWNWKINNHAKKPDVLEIGSLDINGGARTYIQPLAETYIGIDMQEGAGVDLVADAAEYVKYDSFDVIVCNEVFEHTPDYSKIIFNAMTSLREGGIFIATMAGEGRMPHSAIDANPIRPWEYYRNVGEWELNQIMEGFFEKSEVNKLGNDLRCWGIR